MSESRRYLKSTYAPHLWIFSGANIALFWSIIVSQGSLAELSATLSSMTAKDGLLALFAPIVTLVLSGVLSSECKARLVSWRWNHPLPGCRAFSKYLHSDDRIDHTEIVKRWGTLPDDPAAQNALWYRMYRQVQDQVTVAQAHRVSLFSRDLCAHSAVLLPIFAVALILVPVSAVTKLSYIGFLTGQYAVLAVAARNYGERFVCNVLTEQSHRREGAEARQARGT